MLSDRYEVTLNLAEVYIPFTKQFATVKVKAQFADKTVELVHLTHPSSSIQTYGVTRSSPLSLQLLADNYLVASNTVTLGDLYAAQVQGHVEVWVKLGLELGEGKSGSPSRTKSLANLLTEEELAGMRRFARVKLAVNIVKQGAAEQQSSALRQLGPVSCPFLDKVLQAQQLDTETLDLYRKAVEETTQRLAADSGLTQRTHVQIVDVPDKFLDIEIPSLDGLNIDRPSPGDAQTLKNMVIGLSHKVKVLSAQAEENSLLKAQLDKSNKARIELQDSIDETVDSLQREGMGAIATHRELEEARSVLASELGQTRLELTAAKKEVDQLQAENQLLKRENIELKVHEASQKERDLQINRLQTMLSEKENSFNQVTRHREEEVIELKRLKNTTITERRQLIAEKQDLEAKLMTKIIELETTSDQLIRLKGEYELLKSKMGNSGQIGRSTDVYSRYEEHNAEAREQLQKQLGVLVEQSQIAAKTANQTQDKMRADLKNLHEALEIVEDELEDSKLKERDLRRQLIEAKGQIASLEELACVKEDLFAIREDLLKQNEMNRLVKNETLAELDASADYILAQAQRSKESGYLMTQVEDALKEQDQEIEALRYAVAILKRQVANYVPVTGDFVDEALCEYLNTREPPLSVPFVREAREIYAFGTKRVFVRVDKGRISVKVGGGFIPIEEFLAKFERIESEKLNVRAQQDIQQEASETKTRKVVAKRGKRLI